MFLKRSLKQPPARGNPRDGWPNGWKQVADGEEDVHGPKSDRREDGRNGQCVAGVLDHCAIDGVPGAYVKMHDHLGRSLARLAAPQVSCSCPGASYSPAQVCVGPSFRYRPCYCPGCFYSEKSQRPLSCIVNLFFLACLRSTAPARHKAPLQTTSPCNLFLSQVRSLQAVTQSSVRIGKHCSVLL